MDPKELKAIPLFENLTEEELGTILQLAFIKDYKSGFNLFFEGMRGGVMYIILDGEIQIYNMGEGKEHEIIRLGYGEYLGEMTLIDENEVRSASARFTSNTSLLVITKKCFTTMLKTNPNITSKLLMSFLKSMTKRLRQTTEKLNELKSKDDRKFNGV